MIKAYLSYRRVEGELSPLAESLLDWAPHDIQLKVDCRDAALSRPIDEFLAELNSSPSVIFLLNDAYFRSRWCMRELRAFLGRYKADHYGFFIACDGWLPAGSSGDFFARLKRELVEYWRGQASQPDDAAQRDEAHEFADHLSEWIDLIQKLNLPHERLIRREKGTQVWERIKAQHERAKSDFQPRSATSLQAECRDKIQRYLENSILIRGELAIECGMGRGSSAAQVVTALWQPQTGLAKRLSSLYRAAKRALKNTDAEKRAGLRDDIRELLGLALLVRGEPGVGKSQLANAVAQALGWQFISVSIQPRTEYQDLLWEFDAVARLAQAQLLGALGQVEKTDLDELPDSLRRERFVIPGPLWWAVRPKSAEQQAGNAECPGTPYLVEQPKKDGLVLLIDEIDKADANLPNGLLELLGNGDIGLPIASSDKEPLRRPLTLITSNDERQLPPAFMRRCLVLTMKLESEGEALLTQLKQFAQAHADSKQDAINGVPAGIIEEAARVIAEFRDRAREGERPPGAAEFLDLLRVVGGLGGTEQQMQANIQELREIVLLKAGVEGE